MTKEDKFELSRRKALAGLATIGAAGAGAGLGTSAYFSDEESFEGNTITAGELDLWVEAEATYNSDGQAENTEDLPIGPTDGSDLPATIYDLNDVKPGDSGEVTICFSSVDNPAWVWLQGLITANDENSVTEPEADAEGEDNEYAPDDDIDGEGELADALESTLYYHEPGEDLEDAEEVNGELFDGDFSPWQLLDGDGEVGEFSGSEEPEEGEDLDHCLTLDWELPTDVGNEVQTDSLEFAIGLYAEQYRHNDAYAAEDICYASPENPDADGPAGNQPNFNTEQVFELCIDYTADGGELQEVAYNIELAEPWSDPSEEHANMAIGFCGTQDGDGDSLPLDPVADYQISWRGPADDKQFQFSPVVEQDNPTQPYTGSGTPAWQYTTSEDWQDLGSVQGVSASKSGTSITITVEVDDGFPYDPGDIHGILGNASYGGATHANISTDPASAWSGAENFTSTENFIPTEIPDDI